MQRRSKSIGGAGILTNGPHTVGAAQRIPQTRRSDHLTKHHELEPLGLTPRETEILFWVAQGKTSPEISIILGLASATVKRHVASILPKLGVETRLAAALRAHEVIQGMGA